MAIPLAPFQGFNKTQKKEEEPVPFTSTQADGLGCYVSAFQAERHDESDWAF
jgi:hypothetical protein